MTRLNQKRIDHPQLFEDTAAIGTAIDMSHKPAVLRRREFTVEERVEQRFS